MPLTEDGGYTLCQLRAYRNGESTLPVPAWKNRGGILSRVRRKLQGGIQCCAENGVGYTLKLGLKKLGAPRD